jgi:hypothetical protein
MKTKSNKSLFKRKKSITIKKQKQNLKSPSLQILKTHSPLYASKKFPGEEILKYTKSNEEQFHQSCLLENLSWFGSYKVAKSYRTPETHLYEWKTKHPTSLLRINHKNESYFRSLFLNSRTTLVPSIQLKPNTMIKEEMEHPYLRMNTKERAYYEFCFVFGYLSLKEQYEFMKLLVILIQNGRIHMEMRNGSSILNKLLIKINYYRLNALLPKQEKFNRLSFYHLDKHAVFNLCKIVKAKRIPISGLYQSNAPSFWFPNLILYKMNIEETILFHPHRDLVYEKKVEEED